MSRSLRGLKEQGMQMAGWGSFWGEGTTSAKVLGRRVPGGAEKWGRGQEVSKRENGRR